MNRRSKEYRQKTLRARTNSLQRLLGWKGSLDSRRDVVAAEKALGVRWVDVVDRGTGHVKILSGHRAR